MPSAMLRQRAGRRGLSAPTTRHPSLSISVPADVPNGLVALVGGAGRDHGHAEGRIIDDGVILIDGNRIRAVGRRGEVASRRRPPGRRQRQDHHSPA
jgi:hypothetical protein